MTDGKFVFKDKTFDDLRDFECYMNGKECIKIDGYDSERKICRMLLT